MKNLKNVKLKTFRLQGKEFMLTWNPCQLELIDILKQLKIKLSKFEILSYIISREFTNENTSHIHAYIKVTKRFSTIASNFFNLESEDSSLIPLNGQGNYKIVLKTEKYVNYILKDSLNIENDPNYIISPDLRLLIQNGTIIVEKYQATMIKLARQGLIKEALLLLEEKNPDKYLRFHVSYRKSMESLYLQEKGFVPKYDLDKFYLSDGMKKQLHAYLSSSTPRTLEIVGLPGTGKSYFIKAFCKQQNLHPLVVTHVDGLRDFNVEIHNSIIYDDVNFKDLKREQVIKFFDSEDEANIRILHGSVKIPKDTKRFIVANKHLESYIGPLIRDGAISRRIFTIDMGDYSFINVDNINSEQLKLTTGENPVI